MGSAVESASSLWWSSSVPPVIAHRGACLRAPENTLAAFRRAAELGADGIELDAKLTRDGQVVILHDATLDRTTDGQGPLQGYSLAEIRKLDAGSGFSQEFAGERIPSLDEVFAELGRKLLINVEMTNYTTPRDELPRRVVDLVRHHGLESRVLLSSFNPFALRAARAAAPELPLGFLFGMGQAKWMGVLFRLIAPHVSYHLHDPLVHETSARRAHRAGRKLIPWTVNDPARLRWLFRHEVDAIITDAPDMALEVRRDVFPGR
jgi:glycerophosphoryl diester phosphodiesterase